MKIPTNLVGSVPGRARSIYYAPALGRCRSASHDGRLTTRDEHHECTESDQSSAESSQHGAGRTGLRQCWRGRRDVGGGDAVGRDGPLCQNLAIERHRDSDLLALLERDGNRHALAERHVHHLLEAEARRHHDGHVRTLDGGRVGRRGVAEGATFSADRLADGSLSCRRNDLGRAVGRRELVHELQLHDIVVERCHLDGDVARERQEDLLGLAGVDGLLYLLAIADLQAVEYRLVAHAVVQHGDDRRRTGFADGAELCLRRHDRLLDTADRLVVAPRVGT